MFGWLFRDDDDGCADGHHHFTDYTGVRECRITPFPQASLYEIQEKKEATCAHEGCSETHTKWKLLRLVGAEDVRTLKNGGTVVPDDGRALEDASTAELFKALQGRDVFVNATKTDDGGFEVTIEPGVESNYGTESDD